MWKSVWRVGLPYFHYAEGQVFMRVIISKKKVIMFADVQFSEQDQVKTNKKRSSRLPTSNFPPKVLTARFATWYGGPTSRDGAFLYVRLSPDRGVLVSALLKLPKKFQGRMIGHVFTVHDAEKESIWTFFCVLGGQFF